MTSDVKVSLQSTQTQTHEHCNPNYGANYIKAHASKLCAGSLMKKKNRKSTIDLNTKWILTTHYGYNETIKNTHTNISPRIRG